MIKLIVSVAVLADVDADIFFWMTLILDTKTNVLQFLGKVSKTGLLHIKN